MGKMTRPNCICGDASIDDAEHTFIVGDGDWKKRILRPKSVDVLLRISVILELEQYGQLR